MGTPPPRSVRPVSIKRSAPDHRLYSNLVAHCLTDTKLLGPSAPTETAFFFVNQSTRLALGCAWTWRAIGAIKTTGLVLLSLRLRSGHHVLAAENVERRDSGSSIKQTLRISSA